MAAKKDLRTLDYIPSHIKIDDIPGAKKYLENKEEEKKKNTIFPIQLMIRITIKKRKAVIIIVIKDLDIKDINYILICNMI